MEDGGREGGRVKEWRMEGGRVKEWRMEGGRVKEWRMEGGRVKEWRMEGGRGGYVHSLPLRLICRALIIELSTKHMV